MACILAKATAHLDDEGSTSIEYGLIAALIGLAVLAAAALGEKLYLVFFLVAVVVGDDKEALFDFMWDRNVGEDQLMQFTEFVAGFDDACDSIGFPCHDGDPEDLRDQFDGYDLNHDGDLTYVEYQHDNPEP
jgi:Flp pilus assembly pilin Flp